MGNYRGVVRHVRYWRGNIHRWSTVYNFTGSGSYVPGTADAHNLLLADAKLCYPAGAVDQGIYECQIYNNATGGTAIATYTNADWENPATWIPPGGTGWTTTGLGFNANAETALVVEWAAGSSSSGKPVTLRKWYHSVPGSEVVGNGTQISGTDITSLTAAAQSLVGVFAANGLVLSSASGRLAGVAKVLPYFGNHQMPKGRKRKPLVTAGGRYTGPTVVIPDGLLG
jgi:hypothetical protein